MTKNEQILFDLLKEKGIKVTNVYYWNSFSWDSNRGWWADDEDGNEYKLGGDFIEAKGQIIHDEIIINPNNR